MATENEYSPKYPVLTLEKALDIIEILSQESGLGITELSKRLDMGKSTIHRVLDTLMAYGYVDKMTKNATYRLGWKLYEIGNVIPQQRNLNNLDYEELQNLCNRSGETVNVGVVSNKDVVIIAKVEPVTEALRVNKHVGEHEPLHATSLGKVLLSEMTEDELKEIYGQNGASLERYTPNTITELKGLISELKKVREQGYAIDDQEYNLGLVCIAMPLRNYDNKLFAAISVSGPSIRMTYSKINEVKELLAQTSQYLSRYLGSRF